MGFHPNIARDNLCYVLDVGEEGRYNEGKPDRSLRGGTLHQHQEDGLKRPRGRHKPVQIPGW